MSMLPLHLIQQLNEANIPFEKVEKMLSLGKIMKVKNLTKLVEHNKVCDKIYVVLQGGFVSRFIDKELEIEKKALISNNEDMKAKLKEIEQVCENFEINIFRK